MKTTGIFNWIVALAGLWTLVSPFVLNFSDLTLAMWNAIIVGILLVVFGGWAALYKDVNTNKILDWINIGLGLWLIASPFILGYSTLAAALWSSIISGLLVILFAGWAAFSLGRTVSLQS
jgi:hypothetical protein